MISVILVNYNGSRDTIECISSLKESTETDYNIIVVDNKSTDDSVNELKKAQSTYSFDLLEASENRGFSAGNNLGIKKAITMGADYIWLLNNDTLVKPNTMKLLKDSFIRNSSCGMTIAKILYENKRNTIWYAGGAFDISTARTTHFHYGEIESTNYKDIETITFATGCCMFMSKEVINNIGFMDEDYFLYEEDADYSLRLIKHGYKIVYVPQAIVYHKVSASTGTSSPLSQYYICRNKYLLIKKNYQGLNKIKPYLFNTMQMLFRCMKKEMSFQFFRKGLVAFWNNETGKQERGT